MEWTRENFLAIKHLPEECFDLYCKTLRPELVTRTQRMASRVLRSRFDHDNDRDDVVSIVINEHFDRRVRAGTLLNHIKDEEWENAINMIGAQRFLRWRVIDA